MDAPSPKASKARLDVALGSLVWWLATLHIAGELKLGGHSGPFQPRPFCDSMIPSAAQFHSTHCQQDLLYWIREGDLFGAGFSGLHLLAASFA